VSHPTLNHKPLPGKATEMRENQLQIQSLRNSLELQAKLDTSFCWL